MALIEKRVMFVGMVALERCSRTKKENQRVYEYEAVERDGTEGRTRYRSCRAALEVVQ